MNNVDMMRKIIHLDMDCFFAAVEQRDNPALRGKPIGVGGSGRRGVLCTASYEARAFGCRAAMATYKALELCPQLILVPVRFELYQSVSAQIRAILGRFSEKIEPLSLDEAYIDVSHWLTDTAVIAREIRAQIVEETGLTASAGVAQNKLLAKIASDMHKPNGQYVIHVDEVAKFMDSLPVSKLWGVGSKMQEKLQQHGISTCGDMQQLSKITMSKRYGRWGVELFDLCRGVDSREVKEQRVRKSIGREVTFSEDVSMLSVLIREMKKLLSEVKASYEGRYSEREIKSLVIKFKFADFSSTTIERPIRNFDETLVEELFHDGFARGGGKHVRLLGVALRLADEEEGAQLEMF